VDPENLKLGAAIRFSPTAGDADSAIEVGLHGAAITNRDRVHPVSQRKDLNPEFMPEDPGIGEKRLPTAERVQVGSAYAHPVDANQGLASARRGRGVRGDEREPTRCFET